jgi:hypothetical protein
MYPYGYSWPDFRPCFVIKMNKIFGFLPQPFKFNDDLSKYPDIPRDVSLKHFPF